MLSPSADPHEGECGALRVLENAANQNFEGNVPWEQVMHTLHDNGCEADLIYEIRNNANMPEALRDVTARYCYEVGEYLLSLYR